MDFKNAVEVIKAWSLVDTRESIKLKMYIDDNSFCDDRYPYRLIEALQEILNEASTKDVYQRFFKYTSSSEVAFYINDFLKFVKEDDMSTIDKLLKGRFKNVTSSEVIELFENESEGYYMSEYASIDNISERKLEFSLNFQDDDSIRHSISIRVEAKSNKLVYTVSSHEDDREW